jgi:hypothetical protein
MEEMPQDCLEQSRPPHPCGLATQEQLPRSGSFAYFRIPESGQGCESIIHLDG